MPRTSSKPTRPPAAIKKYFEQAPKKVYHEMELYAVYREQEMNWGEAAPRGALELVDLILSSGVLREVKIGSELYTSKRRFIRKDATVYDVALSLSNGGYLTHGTAVFLHNLNDQIPKTIYVNREQTAKGRSDSTLRQDRLKNAFSGRQRTSKYVFTFEAHRIVLLSGKQTGRLGVIEMGGPADERLEVTSIPRTLIDIVVRPGYAGGITQVLQAYKTAVGQTSGKELLKVLVALDYLYPYHQSIGYMLEKAGFPETDIAPFRKCVREFDFFLVHGMKAPDYDERWRLFYPKGF
jgi:predicted transcriptional regulator of viral defense system